jgi:hypothetical protein
MQNPIRRATEIALAIVLTLAGCGAVDPTLEDAAVGLATLDSGQADGDASGDAAASTYGVACHMFTGLGACANAGRADGSRCTPLTTGLGDRTIWHFVPAPNGSWDWDCDGAVSHLHSVSPYVCQDLVDQASCNNAPAGSYLVNPADCGAMAPLQDLACQWAGTLCMPVFQPAVPVHQGCR